MHPACSSIFVTNEFRTQISLAYANLTINRPDFRMHGFYVFQALNTFCEMSNRTVSEGLTRFYSDQYVSSAVVSSLLFQTQAQALFDQFVSSTTNDLLSTLQTMHDINHFNALVSARFTNYDIGLMYYDFQPDVKIVLPIANNYSNCSCDLSPDCIEAMGFYDNVSAIKLYTIPNLYVGCYSTKGLLQSTLECLFNQRCLNDLQFYVREISVLNITVLDPSSLTRFTAQSTVQETVNYMMVDLWNLSSSFEDHYHTCRPIQCTYTDVTKNDAIYIVTTLFSLLGGLVTVLKILIPTSVRVIAHLLRNYNGRLSAVAPMIQ